MPDVDYWRHMLSGLVVNTGIAAESDETETSTELEQITVSAEKEDPLNKDVVTAETIQAPACPDRFWMCWKRSRRAVEKKFLSGSDSGKLRLRGFDETRLRIAKDGVPLNIDGS